MNKAEESFIFFFDFVKRKKESAYRVKMPASHSRFVDCQMKLANMAVLPLRTQIRGPAPRATNRNKKKLLFLIQFR